MGFPERLRKLREKKKLNQTQFGKLFNLSKQAISSYENGGNRPSHETLIKMAEFFEVSIDYLFGLTDDPAPPQAKKKEYSYEEYVLSAPTLAEAAIRIAEIYESYKIDKEYALDLHRLAYKNYGLPPAPGSKPAAHLEYSKPATGVFGAKDNKKDENRCRFLEKDRGNL